jgi:hypothetical protein
MWGLKSPPQTEANSGVVHDVVVAASGAALPTRADGSAAKYILVTSLNKAFFDVGPSGVVATYRSNSILIGAMTPYIFNVAGKTHFSTIRNAQDTIICITPLENQ